jgi:hypothetical protein
LKVQSRLPSSAGQDQHGTFFIPEKVEGQERRASPRRGLWQNLGVVRWHTDRLDQALGEIAATSYGLTLGIHSRIDETERHILGRLKIGNSYVNRSMIGAAVGVQPFGGEGLSSTGPKAVMPIRNAMRRSTGTIGSGEALPRGHGARQTRPCIPSSRRPKESFSTQGGHSAFALGTALPVPFRSLPDARATAGLGRFQVFET